jgi:hypothetical protein
MVYGFYTFITSGKDAYMLFEFDPGNVRKVKEDDQYVYDVEIDKMLLAHNTSMKRQHVDMTWGQLDRWSFKNISDMVRYALKEIFRRPRI